MWTIILVFHVLVAIALIGLILLQQGRGADAGAAFGSGASATIFGARGSGSFLTRTTAILATLFFATSLSMAYLASDRARERKAPPLPQAVTLPQPTEAPAPAPMGTTQSAPQTAIAPATPAAADAPAPVAPAPAQ